MKKGKLFSPAPVLAFDHLHPLQLFQPLCQHQLSAKIQNLHPFSSHLLDQLEDVRGHVDILLSIIVYLAAFHHEIEFHILHWSLLAFCIFFDNRNFVTDHLLFTFSELFLG